jgi:DNA-binding transcriptional regulator/RsmH inhibitor MraZ
MLRSVGKKPEWARIRSDLSPQPCDAVNARRLPMQMAGGVVEAEADSAGKLVEKNVPAAPAAPWTLEPINQGVAAQLAV